MLTEMILRPKSPTSIIFDLDYTVSTVYEKLEGAMQVSGCSVFRILQRPNVQITEYFDNQLFIFSYGLTCEDAKGLRIKNNSF